MKLIHREAIETFPFERMAAVMATMHWTWAPLHRVPEAHDLRLEAAKLFRTCIQQNASQVGSGGLVAFPNGEIGFENKSGMYEETKVLWERA